MVVHQWPNLPDPAKRGNETLLGLQNNLEIFSAYRLWLTFQYEGLALEDADSFHLEWDIPPIRVGHMKATNNPIKTINFTVGTHSHMNYFHGNLIIGLTGPNF